MISAAVEPHVDSFNPDNREPLTPDFATTGKAPGAQRQHNRNKRKILFVTSEIAALGKPVAWETCPPPCPAPWRTCMMCGC